jgi:hypothetical protein
MAKMVCVGVRFFAPFDSLETLKLFFLSLYAFFLQGNECLFEYECKLLFCVFF